MVRHQNWHDPSVLKKVRLRVTIALWLVALAMVYLQHETILRALSYLFN
ncbi:hypothetical protein [Paraflavitalea soli]|nr:hypothetical protein [Paraflavitalea soli]